MRSARRQSNRTDAPRRTAVEFTVRFYHANRSNCTLTKFALALIIAASIISDVLPFKRLWYGEPNAIGNAIGYAEDYSRSHDAAIRVYDEAGNVIATREHKGKFKDW